MKRIRLTTLLLLTLFNIQLFAQNDTTISTFDKVHQAFGGGFNRTEADTFVFPSSTVGYDSVLMHLTLSCPTGGCDDWDRLAYIHLINNGYTFEIARYITPYGIGCGWTIDVTDYISLLKDTVIISSFVDTWVNPGWEISIDFEFKAGTPQYSNSSIANLWRNYYVAYGDTSKPITIEEVTASIPSGVEKVKLRIMNTGHGQGNTDNAAEFSQKTHTIYIDGDSTLLHYLWRDDCGSNPCSPQWGSWQYNRAGWCPGADVLPQEYDITANVTAGQSVRLKYEFNDFTNECSPNYGGCVQGVTCSDCAYNYNGHTEPYYAFVGQLIYYSNSALRIPEKMKNSIEVSIYPNPSQGQVAIVIPNNRERLLYELFTIHGKKVLETVSDKENLTLNLNYLSNGLYQLKVSSEHYSIHKKLVIN